MDKLSNTISMSLKVNQIVKGQLIHSDFDIILPRETKSTISTLGSQANNSNSKSWKLE